MKTNISAILQLIGLILIGILFSACQPCDDPTDPECKNYDPCYNLGPVSADFQMIESIYNDPTINYKHEVEVVTRKHLSINPLRLVALDSSELTHQWKIGNAPVTRENLTEIITFNGYVGPLTITHIVSGKPNRDCFSDDDGLDTVTKTIEIIPFVEGLFEKDGDLPIYGTFQGYHSHIPGNIFDITISLDTPVFTWQNKFVKAVNLPNGCPGLHSIEGGANGFLINGSGAVDFDACWGVYNGRAELRANGDSIVIHHLYSDPDSLLLTPPKFIERESTFFGKRR